jgi:hypothetical protein
MATERVRRTALKQLRAQLEEEADALRAEQARLEHSQDQAALRDLADRLARYRENLQVYKVALDHFQQQFGVLGD